METVALENLAKGMTADIRDDTPGMAKLLKNFDILTRPHTLMPYHSMVEADTSSATNRLSDFIWRATNSIYGVGTNSSTTKITILNKIPGTSTWSAAANNAGTAGKTLIPGSVVEYHAKFYGIDTAGEVFKADPSGSAAWVDADATLTGATSAQVSSNGIVHSKDDILYYGYLNKIAANNNGSWNTAAITLPSKYLIKSICEYGNYLAIACDLADGTYGQSIVYLWDRDSTLNTISEVIDFGTGSIQLIQQVESVLVGISLRTNLIADLPNQLVFREYSGTTADVVLKLIASSPGIAFGTGQKLDQYLYFISDIVIDGMLQSGIWGFGKDSAGKWRVWLDRSPNNDTVVASGALVGFLMTGDYALVAYNDSGYIVRETSTVSTDYTASSIIETVLNPAMKRVHMASNKQLQAVAVSYDPIPSGGQVIFKYKVNGSAWTTLFTETTTGKVVTESVYDVSGTAITSGHEYQFRFESMGGVLLTGLKYKYELLESLV